MLSIYFLKRFFIRFVLILIGLIPLFASGDIVIRLAVLPFSYHILQFLLFMLPLVSIFAIPIATCIAVGITVGNLFSKEEFLFFHFFSTARRTLERSVGIFSLILFVVYIPIVFQLAPSSYWQGKQFIINFAKQHIEHLQAQRFHYITSRCAIFFQDKINSPSGVHFKNILLRVKGKNNEQYLITAQTGDLQRGDLFFDNGTVYNTSNEKHYIATFKKLKIAFDKLFFQENDNYSLKNIKFFCWKELKNSYLENNNEARRELHKRIVQIIWQLLFPFLMLWSMMIYSKNKSNVLLSIVFSGLFFLFSYISLNMAYFLLTKSLWSILFFYSIPFGVALFFYKSYKKRWF